jgi:dihydroxyacid dehydratase/phosphogluconate dehydratase
VLTAAGEPLGAILDWWEGSERRRTARAGLQKEGIDPDLVIHSPESAHRAGLSGTLVFPTGNLAPQGAVVKATAIDPSVIGEDGVYFLRGPARVFTSEHAAIQAIKGQVQPPIQPGDVLVYIGGGPMGTGMEETYQLTSALKYIPWGKQVALLTDARFSGVSTGACIGHIGPEALAGGPIGRLRDGDVIEILIDRTTLTGQVNLVGCGEDNLSPQAAQDLLNSRAAHPGLHARSDLPDDTRLWAALQTVSGGIWGGAVYDVESILKVIEAGVAQLNTNPSPQGGA